MIILGVDPGTLITGYGVIEASRGTMRLVEYNVVRSRSDRSMPLRLKAIYSNLCDIIERHHPDEFAIETAFYGKNAQSALKIGHARGVSILAAVNYEVPTAEYSPREVKKSVVGNGAASKQQVLYMVRSLLKLRETPRYYDATDALAVAICHYLRHSSMKVLSKTRRKYRSIGTSTTSGANWKSFVHNNPHRIKRA